MLIIVTVIALILNLLILRHYVKKGDLKDCSMENVFFTVLLYIIPIVNVGMLISNFTDLLGECEAEPILKKIFFIKE